MNSTSVSGLTLSTGASRTEISVEPVILTPTLYPDFIFRMSMSGPLNAWWGMRVPTYVLPSLETDSLVPSTAPSDSRVLESDSEYMLLGRWYPLIV